MKKVLAFVLILAIALGGMVFAHIAVSDSQDELIFYPTLEEGDPAVLQGLTASMTIHCGEHLFWNTEYAFGREAVTDFVYSRKAVGIHNHSFNYTYMDLSLYGSDFEGYRRLVQSVAAQTPPRSTITQTLLLSEHLSCYLPSCSIQYRDKTMESKSFFTEDPLSALFQNEFRFPVREGNTMTIKVTRDSEGQITKSITTAGDPKLYLHDYVSDEGIWFLMEFRDENGILPYESPQGHGIYYLPWKTLDEQFDYGLLQISPDVEGLRQCVPLEEGPVVEDLSIDTERGLAHVLTQEDGAFILSTYDLRSGAATARLELIQAAEERTHSYISRYRGDYLLLRVRDQIVLTDAAGENILLTAPDPWGHNLSINNFDPELGDVYFDGKTLFLAVPGPYDPAYFTIAAFQQDAMVFYCEYDCSIMQGNENWYYSNVTAESYPIRLKPNTD